MMTLQFTTDEWDAYNTGYADGYVDGYNDADQECFRTDFPLVCTPYNIGYLDGYADGFDAYLETWWVWANTQANDTQANDTQANDTQANAK